MLLKTMPQLAAAVMFAASLVIVWGSLAMVLL
jgi:hypothetical protein